MEPTSGGTNPTSRQRDAAAEIARKKVLAAYSSDANTIGTFSRSILSDPYKKRAYRNLGYTARRLSAPTTNTPIPRTPTAYKQAPIQTNIAQQKVQNSPSDQGVNWQKYHSAWQYYYQKYYSEYYAKAANQMIENERLKNNVNNLKNARKEHDEKIINPDAGPTNPTDEEERSIIEDLKQTVRKHAKKDARKSRIHRKFIPIIAGVVAVLLILFLQYNRMIFAPIMAYVSPGNTSDTGITEVDPTITKAVGPDNRLMIPKLNVDVPVHFGISNDTDTVNAAMEEGVAQFSIPGASAMPGQIGNLVITGHSAGDIYSNNQYKFIFSGLERLVNGDLIYIDYGGTRYTYTVTKQEVVEPDNVGALVYSTDKPMLTLITCTPLGTSRYRLLVTAEQISPAPSGATQEVHTDDNAEQDNTMPQNEPTFFERIWNWLTGQN
ncbi:sortase [Candidatus Saccharibacteria bacterium]|nr:sortase [Candidatus Saccharibacteria bacterium]